jgi:hypothetical protein
VQRLQRFAVNGHLKQYVLNMITEDIMGSTEVMGMEETAEMITPLRDMFARLDKDGSGDVSVDELVVRALSVSFTFCIAKLMVFRECYLRGYVCVYVVACFGGRLLGTFIYKTSS